MNPMNAMKATKAVDHTPVNPEKTAVFDYLGRLARDPFAQVEHASDPAAALARAGLSDSDLRHELVADEEIAGGSWASCQTCSDPGPDRHPDK
jgi:hypothetical protein